MPEGKGYEYIILENKIQVWMFGGRYMKDNILIDDGTSIYELDGECLEHNGCNDKGKFPEGREDASNGRED